MLGKKISKISLPLCGICGFQSKYYLFSPSIFLLPSSLIGQYSSVLHKFFTYPTPIRQNCLIGTTILDTKLTTKFETRALIATFFKFRLNFQTSFLLGFHTKKHFKTSVFGHKRSTHI